jgi:hypothetical protein
MATRQLTQQQVTQQRKKPYSPPQLRRLDPEDALARLQAAARAGDACAQAMLDEMSRRRGPDPKSK